MFSRFCANLLRPNLCPRCLHPCCLQRRGLRLPLPAVAFAAAVACGGIRARRSLMAANEG